MTRSLCSSLWNLRKAVSPTAIHLPADSTGSTTNPTVCYLCARFVCNPSARSLTVPPFPLSPFPPFGNGIGIGIGTGIELGPSNPESGIKHPASGWAGGSA